MNTPVSYPLAKLLKEKRFDLSTERFYPKPKCKLFGIDEHGRLYPIVNKTQTYFKGKAAVLKEENYYDAPTISDVVMWLYEKHGIWISVDPENDTNTWFHTITHGNSTTVFGNYSSLTEAYEAGIEDVLINMI